MEHGDRDAEIDAKRDIARKLDAGEWGAFFVWIGVVLFADVAAGWTLTGIGLVMIGVQITRAASGLKLEGFWAVVGGCFSSGESDRSLMPESASFPLF